MAKNYCDVSLFPVVSTAFQRFSIVRTLPPPFTKGGEGLGGGIDFLIFGNKGGDKKFFLEREGLD